MGADRRVVLVGAGHAHLHVASRASEFRRNGAELTLIDPDAFWYSGLATGMLGGLYPRELDRIDPGPVARRAGGRFIRDRVVGIDRQRSSVTLESGASLPYDLLSLNVGSEVSLGPLAPLPEAVWPVKPIRGLWQLRRRLEERLAAEGAAGTRILVVGGGATGCEVAANVAALARSHGSAPRITLVTDEDRLLTRRGQQVSRRLARYLRGRGVDVMTGTEIVELRAGVAATGRGLSLPFDFAALATGLQPPRWLADLGVELGPNGGLLVDETLRSVDDQRLFGAGDCIRIANQALPMLGVYAVREAPILTRNLLAMLSGSGPRRYRPQKRCLTILNLGEGYGLALWGPFHWLGPSAMWLKDRIDRRFLGKYRVDEDASGTAG